MIKALKITMVAYGIGGSLFGLLYLLAPQLAIAMQSPGGAITAFLIATKMALGAGILGAGSFLALAARDPIKNISWVGFGIVNAALFLLVALYAGFVLYEEPAQATVGIVLHGVFGTMLFVLYPRGATINNP